MISELLAYDFMQRAILAVIAISIFSPILGLFLILRRQSLMSDTLSHVSLAGVAVGIFLGLSTTWMTIVVVVIAALVLEYLRVSYKHYMEISTAILMSMGLAVALILSNKAGSSSMSLDSYLFGSIITISSEQVHALFVIAAIVLVLTLLFIRPMYLLTFDEDTAAFSGTLANYTHLKKYNDGGFTVTLSGLPAGATAQLKSSDGKVLAEFTDGTASTSATQFTGSGSATF